MKQKNIATLENEIYKQDAIAINRLGMYKKLQEKYGTNNSLECLQQLEVPQMSTMGRMDDRVISPVYFHIPTTTIIRGTGQIQKNG